MLLVANGAYPLQMFRHACAATAPVTTTEHSDSSNTGNTKRVFHSDRLPLRRMYKTEIQSAGNAKTGARSTAGLPSAAPNAPAANARNQICVSIRSAYRVSTTRLGAKEPAGLQSRVVRGKLLPDHLALGALCGRHQHSGFSPFRKQDS
jgi:hypothetical protein